MIRLAKISILTTYLWIARAEFGVNERATQGNESPEQPHTENKDRGVHLLSYELRNDEDTCCHDAAHD
jgi:hypothetical protein